MNPRNFKLNSDYPIDKVVGYSTGSVVVSAFNTATPSVAHGLSYAPLYYLKWSTDPNFTISYDMPGLTNFNNYILSVDSDSTNINFFGSNNTGSSVTLYYRVLYFMPTNVNVSADETQSDLDAFVLNTDYNYTKILTQGVTAGANQNITHDLGYYPQVEVWYERVFDGKIVYVTGNLPNGTWSPVASISTTQLLLSDSTGVVSKWHYKIYVDEV